MNMKKAVLLVIAAAMLLGFSACRATKKIQQVIVKKDTVAVVDTPVLKVPTHEDTVRMANDVLANVEKKYISFNTFSAKIKVDYSNSKGRQPDFVANVRMLKDSVIWISLSNDIGIEGIRVLITKDSIKMLDKLANTYQVRPLSHIQELAQIPFTFSDLQNILVGNPIFFSKDSITSYSNSSNGYSILSYTTLFKNLLTIAADYSVTKSKLDDNDPTLNRTCDLIYNDYESKTGMFFSTQRQITISQRNKLEVQLRFKDYKFNEELTYPFSVPKKFKRI
ncbi:uncharacterized protein DUF4292 [Lacibacter cauensis]|uniref:Uncharacterized protein DUF4292 n=2 Tax=Lacibacter cauensis TaxID=510947 RepID=A0A562SJ07_9BACT|nr:uncharacterized protein DUF4292 [Lacibacter cauensis]